MSRMVCDYANPRGRQGMVWTRFPLSTRPTPPDNEDQGKGNAREDLCRRSESPYLIIPSPEDDEENPPPDWFESVSDSELNNPDETYEGFDAGDDDDELDAMIGIPEMARLGNKSFASLLTHQMAKDLVNQVIDTGLESWEFRWMSNVGTNRQCRVGWSRPIPQAPKPTSKRRCSGPKESHTHPSTLAEPNSISLSEDKRGQLSQRKGELQTQLDILLGAVSAILLPLKRWADVVSSGRARPVNLAAKMELLIWEIREPLIRRRGKSRLPRDSRLLHLTIMSIVMKVSSSLEIMIQTGL